MVAGAEDNLHICLNEAGESPVEQGGAFGVGDATVVDVPANEEGVNAFGPNVVEQFVDELSVLVGERAAVKGAAEVPVGGVQNLHGFSMAPLEKVRLAVRHSRFGPHRGVGAHAERGSIPDISPSAEQAPIRGEALTRSGGSVLKAPQRRRGGTPPRA